MVVNLTAACAAQVIALRLMTALDSASIPEETAREENSPPMFQQPEQGTPELRLAHFLEHVVRLEIRLRKTGRTGPKDAKRPLARRELQAHWNISTRIGITRWARRFWHAQLQMVACAQQFCAVAVTP